MILLDQSTVTGTFCVHIYHCIAAPIETILLNLILWEMFYCSQLAAYQFELCEIKTVPSSLWH